MFIWQLTFRIHLWSWRTCSNQSIINPYTWELKVTLRQKMSSDRVLGLGICRPTIRSGQGWLWQAWERGQTSSGLSTLLCATFSTKPSEIPNSNYHLLRIYYASYICMYYFWSLHQLSGSVFYQYLTNMKKDSISLRTSKGQSWVSTRVWIQNPSQAHDITVSHLETWGLQLEFTPKPVLPVVTPDFLWLWGFEISTFELNEFC